MAILLAGALSALFCVGRSHAGSGHDHGPAPAAAASQTSPRLIANSETYYVVGIVEGEVLVIYLDQFSDNSPVTSATLEVTIDDQATKVELLKNGTYEVTSQLLKQPGDHSIIVNIVDGDRTDLLVGSVRIPPVSGAVSSVDRPIWARFTISLEPHHIGAGGALGLFLILVWALLWRGRKRAASAAASLGIAVLAVSSALAHEGHDHGPAAPANGNAPQRLANGMIFLPKPTQRLLEVRTRILQPETAARMVRFHGRVIADPNKSGVVQSTIQGRFSAPAGGVPLVGARVKAGDLMGRVAPSFASKESADVMQTLGELDQQISLARAKLNRQEQLLRTNVVAHAAVDETRIQLEGFLKRRTELLESRVQPEELRAPVDGVVIAARVVPGQVVSQTDQLFQIVEPSSLIVEALQFEQAAVDDMNDAVATFGDGKSTRLKFLGRSRSLQQQYAVMRFSVLDPQPTLNVGSPVIVIGSTGQLVEGLRLPRAAIAQAPNGQMVVFVHKDAEIFEPRAVRFTRFDADTVLIVAGLEKGDKVVVQNAPLINQVR